MSRWDKIVLSHLHIRHTHIYQMTGDDVPRWLACECDLTVEHILIECRDFVEVRQRFYNGQNLQLFHEICVTKVFEFLHEIGLFHWIKDLLVHDDMWI